jgi:predicted  nucleic acid-binding Zn-ribbon protein
MTETASADTPLAVDRVDRARGDHHGVKLRMTGRWLRPADADQGEPLLVVQVQGRRHRFPSEDGGQGSGAHNGEWEATFNVPSWAEPSREGQAALWVGTEVVPVPLPRSASAAAGAPTPGAAPSTAAATPGYGEGLRPGEVPDTIVDTGRTGPLAELLFKESVSALHAELEQRSADVARLQGSLANARSELEARTAMQAALESAHSDLRNELHDLMSAVNVQRADFEKRLASAEDTRAAGEAERDRLRAELNAARDATQREADAGGERARRELAELIAARDALTTEVADLRARLARTQAVHQQHAAEVAALRDQLASAQVSRDAAVGEVAGLRAELERVGSELAVAREHQAAQGGDLGEAQRLLAEARSLSEQLRSQSSH